MKTYRLFFIFLFIFSAALLQSGFAQSDIDTDKLNRFFTTLHDNNRFMGSVAVMSGDQVVFEEAYGIISENGISATSKSIYRTGSITKSYTATMILQLMERGEMSLNTTLITYFPDMPNADQITIEQMLRHQSGLVNFTNSRDYLEYSTTTKSREDMLELFEAIGTSFEPGKKTEYSNTAYVLLGYIIEEVTGVSYANALREMVTEPLGLTSTYFGSGIDSEKNEADSFVYHQGNWLPALITNLYITHGAGAIVSTAEEVARFYQGLFSGELLSDESLEQMITFEGRYGLGLIRYPFDEKMLIGYNGRIDGNQSVVVHFPERDLTFSVMGNGINYGFNQIMIGLLRISFGNDYEMPTF